MVKLCCWNVRGLNDRNKRSLVKSVVACLRDTVLCIQESKISSISHSFLSSFAGSLFDKCQFIPASGASGGIITCWHSGDFACSEVLVRDFSLTLRLVHRASGLAFAITNVYVPPSWAGKDSFCNELRALKPHCAGPWVLCGDFNLTRHQDERRGRPWCAKLMNLFSSLISDLELIDLPLANQQFTWSNMQRNPTLAKLDRFLVST